MQQMKKPTLNFLYVFLSKKTSYMFFLYMFSLTRFRSLNLLKKLFKTFWTFHNLNQQQEVGKNIFQMVYGNLLFERDNP